MPKPDKIQSDLNKFLDTLGEDIVSFDMKGDGVQKAVNNFIKRLRANLEKHNHIASGNLYQALGEGWQTKVNGKKVTIQLVLPEYYEATDTGRKATKSGGSGAVYNNLQGLRGWISQKGLVPSGGKDFERKWKLKDGTIKTKKFKLSAEKANKALAFMISRKIHRFGFKGTKWFSSQIEDFESELLAAISKEFAGATLTVKIN